nr:hypothetical protein [Tanacetum cinerariifolium]
RHAGPQQIEFPSSPSSLILPPSNKRSKGVIRLKVGKHLLRIQMSWLYIIRQPIRIPRKRVCRLRFSRRRIEVTTTPFTKNKQRTRHSPFIKFLNKQIQTLDISWSIKPRQGQSGDHMYYEI